MSETTMQVELVSADRLVWSGEARMVVARTTEGDVGILPNHAPMLSLMVDGVVDVQTTDGETWIAAVDAGFLDRVVAADGLAAAAREAAAELAELDPTAYKATKARSRATAIEATRKAIDEELRRA